MEPFEWELEKPLDVNLTLNYADDMKKKRIRKCTTKYGFEHLKPEDKVVVMPDGKDNLRGRLSASASSYGRRHKKAFSVYQVVRGDMSSGFYLERLV